MGLTRGAVVALALSWVALTGPSGPVYVQPANVIEVVSEPGLAKAPTEVVTMNSTFFVKETPEEVMKKFKAAN